MKLDGLDEARADFYSLDSNGDSEVSTEELKIGYFFKEDGPFHGHFDEFSAKYWPIFDTDNSGTINFEEHMYFYSAVLDGGARLMIKVRKLTCLSN